MESPEPGVVPGDLSHTFKEDVTPMLLKLCKNYKRRDTSHVTLECQHRPDSKSDKDITRNDNCRPKSIMKRDAKVLNRILAERI